MNRAIDAVPYQSVVKVGLQFKRRFWEQDDGIYGGHSSTDQEIVQIVYRSHGLNSRKGVLIGYYVQGQAGRPIGDKTPAERLALAHVIDREFDRFRAGARRQRADDEALILERAHDVIEAFAFVAQQRIVRH